MAEVHLHTRKDELGVFWIPADTDIPMQYKVIGNDWRAMASLVGGYTRVLAGLETVPELYCGCEMVLAFDEEGLLKQSPQNLRASALYKYDSIVGDTFLIGQGMVDSEMGPEPDLFSLPPDLHRWAGPGEPLPPQADPLG